MSADVKSEADWQAECDARTIAQAAAIQADEKRHKAASKAAKRLRDEELAQGKAMDKLARLYPNSPEITGKKKDGKTKK